MEQYVDKRLSMELCDRIKEVMFGWKSRGKAPLSNSKKKWERTEATECEVGQSISHHIT